MVHPADKNEWRLFQMKTRKTLLCILDTETVGGFSSDCQIYNAGGKIVDYRGHVYATFNYLVAEHFESILEKAHYGKKNFNRYLEMLDRGEITVVATEADLLKAVSALLDFYGVKYVLAYNTIFDLTRTSFQKLIENREFIDIYQMAYEIYYHRPSYRKFCIENGFLTKNGNPQQGVEQMYAFLTNNPAFEEEHTAYSDAAQEAEIFFACLRQHKRYTKNKHHGECFTKKRG